MKALCYARGNPYYCCQCGDKLLINVHRSCPAAIAPQKPLIPCPHFLGGNGETALIFGCGCAGETANGIETSLCECALHSVCSLWSKGGTIDRPGVTLCVNCPDNPNGRRVW